MKKLLDEVAQRMIRQVVEREPEPPQPELASANFEY
jgi:hypothetical protein